MNVREPGTILDGKYEILQRLGSGGMGEVYRARHLHLEEERVIKILRQDLAADRRATQRFLQEARIATQIKHPNVAILYDCARLGDGSFYMVWEHIDGEDVGSRLRREGPFSLPLALDLGIQALRGLNAIHEAGVIHRDVSPDNLMITGGGRRPVVKIIDLGLAKALAPSGGLEITEAGAFLGKLRYCSPEQAGLEVEGGLDHRSDLYSLAAVLYEMISGLAPFDSEGQHGFAFKRLKEDPIPLSRRVPSLPLPPAVDRVLAQGLERDRERRYPDARRFIEALVRVADALRGVDTQEVPATPPAGSGGSGAQTGGGGGRRELSKEERSELLARIDKAAKRAEEGSTVLQRAQQAFAGGRLAEARALVAGLETSHPRLAGLAKLKLELQRSEDRRVREEKIRQTEEMLERYVKERRQAAARLALEALLDLYPNHPRRGDYESWVDLLGEEERQQERADDALRLGRAALARGDHAEARKQLVVLEREAPSESFAAAFRSELAAAEEGEKSSVRSDTHRRRFTEHLEHGDLDAADRELRRLAALDITRVTLDGYRSQLEEAQRRRVEERELRSFEQRYRDRLAAKDWPAAREVALELEREFPSSARSSQMFTEVARLESVHQRQQAVEQGVRQLEEFLTAGRSDEAATALRILIQLDPENPRRRELERRVRALSAS